MWIFFFVGGIAISKTRGPLLHHFEFGPVFQEMSFKDSSYLELWQLLCLMKGNHFCNLVEYIIRNNSVKSF